MKRFNCQCGQTVFFENTVCVTCGRELGFDPVRLALVTLQPGQDGTLSDDAGRHRYRHCRNRLEHAVCNWLVPASGGDAYCRSCAMNEVIPNLEAPGNHLLWGRLELAKRRMLYSLLSLQLPMTSRADTRALRFAFLEDQRRNPHVGDSYVSTGHHDGLITINVAEADDATRHAIREMMFENYRTLLGHFRHEAGHFYFDYLVEDAQDPIFGRLFGDWRQDYASALERYYENGPPAGWQSTFISAYASAHPLEDWAEIFAHYLHITETLETAQWTTVDTGDGADWIQRWQRLSVGLNELNRSLGAPQPYPFVLSDLSIEKLRFLHRRVHRREESTA